MLDSTNTFLTDPYYSNWETASMQESPDNYGGYQPCAYMSMPDLKWGDMSCVEEQAGAICDLGKLLILVSR